MSNVNKALAQLVEKATSLGENVVDFCKAQAPELVNQYLHWEFVTSMAWAVGAGIVIIIGIILILRGRKLKRMGKEEESWGLLIGVGVGMVIIFTIPLLAELFTCIKIKCFPDLYLFDTLMNLVKTMK